MSQENVEVVRRAHEAFMRRDNESVFSFYDPEVEVRSDMDCRVYRGFEGVREYLGDWLSIWEGYGSELEEWIDAGDHVIAVLHAWGRGKQSGAAVDTRAHHVWTLRDGKLLRLRIYRDRTEALEAVGLRG